MQHEIKVQKGDGEQNLEVEIIKKISREKFFVTLHDNNMDIKYLMKSCKEDFKYLDKFNFFLRKIKINYQITISEAVLFIEEEGYKLKNVISLLSQENKSILETELLEKYKHYK